MSAKARYRAANWMMWFLLAVFLGPVLAILYSSDAGRVWTLLLVFGIMAFPVLMAIGAALSWYAFLTVVCGGCGNRFFDFFFIGFPVQGGCRVCHAQIEEAYTIGVFERAPGSES